MAFQAIIEMPMPTREEMLELVQAHVGLEDRMQKLEAEMVSFRRAIKSLIDDVKARSLRQPV